MKSQYIAAMFCVCAAILLVAPGCGSNDTDGKTGDKILAKFRNKSLYLSELEGLIPNGSSGEDSVLIINAYVERWLRENILLQEAELNVPKDLNIDKLVRDYRASLLKHNYELILVNQLLDSVVTKAELDEFYEKNKDQFHLDEPILRAHFVKIPAAAPELAQFQKWWNNYEKPGNFPAIQEYSKTYASVAKLNDSVWYEINDLAADMPPGWLTPSNTNSKKEFIQRDDNFAYFFRVLDLINSNSVPPFSYVEDKARRVILHQRKQKLLDQKKEEMYERELRQNNIKVFQP